MGGCECAAAWGAGRLIAYSFLCVPECRRVWKLWVLNPLTKSLLFRYKGRKTFGTLFAPKLPKIRFFDEFFFGRNFFKISRHLRQEEIFRAPQKTIVMAHASPPNAARDPCRSRKASPGTRRKKIVCIGGGTGLLFGILVFVCDFCFTCFMGRN